MRIALLNMHKLQYSSLMCDPHHPHPLTTTKINAISSPFFVKTLSHPLNHRFTDSGAFIEEYERFVFQSIAFFSMFTEAPSKIHPLSTKNHSLHHPCNVIPTLCAIKLTN